MVGVFFLWTIVNHNVGIRDSSVCWDVLDFIMVEYDEGIRALRSRIVITLCEIAPFFSKCRCPYRLSGGICGEFLVFCDFLSVMGWMTAAQYGVVLLFLLYLPQTVVFFGVFSHVHWRGNCM